MAETLAELAAGWRRDLRAAERTERTVELYGQTVRLFAEWCRATGREDSAASLTKPDITEWLTELRDRGLAPGTLRVRHDGLYRLCRWLVAEGLLDKHPLANLAPPAVPETPVPVLSDADVERLFKVTAGPDFTDRRDHAILRVLFDCGLRISELAGLTTADVDLTHHDVLHVLGKGRRPRAVPFGAKTGRALDRYRRARAGHRYAELPAFFLTQRGAMSRDAIDERIRRRAEQAGVAGLHAHRFRHTFAHRWLSAGGQERDLMRLAGWASRAMLDRYGASATGSEFLARTWGFWTEHKLDLLSRYLPAFTRAAQKLASGTTVYMDLFAGESPPRPKARPSSALKL